MNNTDRKKYIEVLERIVKGLQRDLAELKSYLDNEDGDKPEHVYAIGIKDKRGGYGMTHGPWESMEDILEVDGRDGAYILQLNKDDSHTPLYKWRDGEWRKLKTT